MSEQALRGILTYIEAHKFDISDDLELTAVGCGDGSAVSTKNSAGDWQHIIKPSDEERINATVSAGGQVYALRVWLKFEKIVKS